MNSNSLPDQSHPAVCDLAIEHFRGDLTRREFLARATSLGITAGVAWTMLGSTPTRASTGARMGGTLRCQMKLYEMREPRLYEWAEMGNVTRGWLEHLVQYNADGSFTPVLLESWEANADATRFTLKLRKGVTWNNGDPFDAEDVARNLRGWCDTSLEGNSMATRMDSLVDPETGQAADGSIVVADRHTVVLNLLRPDITLIASLSDYPAAVTHVSLQGGDPIANPVGTGPYLPESYVAGDRAVIVRNPDHTWWNDGNGAYLDRVEFIDLGTDPAAIIAAARAGEVDMVYETTGDFIDILDATDLERSEAMTAATLVTRTNQNAEIDGQRPYGDVRVRRALQGAVDNAICLELGYADRGAVAENHHVSPLHPAYAEIPRPVTDPAAALELMREAGMEDFEHELVSLDDGWERDTTDAVAAQLRDAGMKVSRRVVAGSVHAREWANYPFSSTAWNHRPFGTQVLALAYRSGSPWNETGFSNETFDRLLDEANALQNTDMRREKMRGLEQILREEGVVIQPFWRSIFNHRKPGLVNAQMHPQFEVKYQYIGYAL